MRASAKPRLVEIEVLEKGANRDINKYWKQMRKH
jgi:hypothetical protein